MSNPEKQPSLNLNFGDGRKMELTPENTTLFTFLGRTAIGDMQFENASVNHVFVQTGRSEEDQPKGVYYFERFHPVYKDIADFAIKNSFPAVANMRTVAECDLVAYMGQVDLAQANFAARLEGVEPSDFDK